MITKKIIEKIEGEAEVFFEEHNNTVEFATISFGHMRGFSTILQNKPALDALVFTPRICGICGHSHLYATARALEDAYKNAGYKVELSEKAIKTREITLMLEIIQNHIKWLYLTVIPKIDTLKKQDSHTKLKSLYSNTLISKIIALLAGQYPHNSYMLPGGITSDFTYIDITKAIGFLDELTIFLEKEFFGISLEQFLTFESCKDFNQLQSDLGDFESDLVSLNMQTKGFGFDRFLVLAEHNFTQTAKIKKTVLQKADHKYLSTSPAYSPHQNTYAYNALYKDEFIEVGPLARTMANNIPIIKNIHRRYKDSAYARSIARIYEIPFLIQKIKTTLLEIDVTEPSFIEVPNIKKITAQGTGIVEAPRGSLIHSVSIEKGIIQNYEIITPTQFNLASGTREKPSIAQNAMKGLTKEEATFIFRIFDVCSVCTTH
ncbi:MAG: hydrogenase [Epsilonproteobacteria bacterium]|nr:hydrogenase [Campylobacterota bacterium]